MRTALLVSGGMLLMAGISAGEETVGEIRDRCLRILREGLLGGEFWPAMHAAEALTLAGQGAEVRERVEPLLPDETDDQRRCGLARELVRAGGLEKEAVLHDILGDEGSTGRVHAAESLFKVGWRGDGKVLRQALESPGDGGVRLQVMAAAALAKGGDRASVEFLRVVLADEPDPAVFVLAAWALARLGDEAEVRLIRSRLADAPEARSRAFLEHALARLGDGEGKRALLRNLGSEEAGVRIQAAEFAGEAGMRDALPLLMRQLEDVDRDARIRAAQAWLQLQE